MQKPYSNNIEFCDNIEQPRLTKSFLSTRHRHLTLKLRDLDNGIQVSINQGQGSLGDCDKYSFKTAKTILKYVNSRLITRAEKLEAKYRFPKDCTTLTKWIIENKICY